MRGLLGRRSLVRCVGVDLNFFVRLFFHHWWREERKWPSASGLLVRWLFRATDEKKMRTLHLYLYMWSQKYHTSHNPFHVLGLSKLFMMVLMYHFQDRKRKPSHCADSFITGRQISEVLSWFPISYQHSVGNSVTPLGQGSTGGTCVSLTQR